MSLWLKKVAKAKIPNKKASKARKVSQKMKTLKMSLVRRLTSKKSNCRVSMLLLSEKHQVKSGIYVTQPKTNAANWQ